MDGELLMKPPSLSRERLLYYYQFYYVKPKSKCIYHFRRLRNPRFPNQSKNGKLQSDLGLIKQDFENISLCVRLFFVAGNSAGEQKFGEVHYRY